MTDVSPARQEESRVTDLGSGRVNQKKRTRAAIVQAARELIEEGTSPTVSQAAERAMVSRTTAYRYFPTQDSLLLEVSVDAGVDDIEELVHQPLDGGSAIDRTVEVMRRLNTNVLDEQVRYRMANRLYLDLWLAAVSAGDDAPVVREGRRTRWLTETLAGELDGVPAKDRRRLVAALGSLMGREAMSVLCDIGGLERDEALDTSEWAARTLIAATVDARKGATRKHRAR